MPAYKHNQVVDRYTVKKDEEDGGFHNRGGNANSYAAIDSGGKKVFLKRYSMPGPKNPWFQGFVDYQAELKRRVDGDPVLKEFCYKMIHFFIFKKFYHQVFEWIDNSKNLSVILEEGTAGRGPDFAQRAILARRLMGSMTALHGAKIVHVDLKPENLLLIKDPTILAGHKLMLIDMDFSVLSDRKAPWHGSDTGYMGTPNYYSPEHLRGEPPVETSDVFTCSLILHELLGAGHPYESESANEYRDKALNHRAPKPSLGGVIKAGGNDITDMVAKYLHACLHPDPAQRPSAKKLRDALNGRASGSPPPPPNTVTLEGPSGGSMFIRIKTRVGKSNVTHFGDDAKYWANVQFILDKQGDGWVVTHDTSAKNKTLLNGRAVAGTQPVKDGDELAVGSESRSIAKLPLKVRIG